MSPDDQATMQPFVCTCPHCRTSIRGKLHTVAGTIQPNLASEDFDVLLDATEDPDDPAVTVATDTPVHASIARGRAAEPMLTPFIQIWASLGPERAAALMANIGGIRDFRESSYPALRRAALAFVRGDTGAVTKTLVDDSGEARELADQFPPATILGYAFMRAYAAIDVEDVMDAAQAEKSGTFELAVKTKPAALLEVLSELRTEMLPEHMRNVIDTALTQLGDAEPLISALCAEQLEETKGLADYRVTCECQAKTGPP